MEHFGQFPWQEILTQTLTTVLAYFAGRYRKVYKGHK